MRTRVLYFFRYKMVFPPLKFLMISSSVLGNTAVRCCFFFSQNNPENLDRSYKMAVNF